MREPYSPSSAQHANHEAPAPRIKEATTKTVVSVAASIIAFLPVICPVLKRLNAAEVPDAQ